MYKNLLDILKEKPVEYKPGKEKFWDDEHISKEMLYAHLNPDIEAASRNHNFILKSANWIASMCQEKRERHLLDLGCGPGIYAELFCDLGFKVIGIDFSKRSIEYAKKSAKLNNKAIEYFYQDYRTIRYENQFDVATLIYCDYGVLSPHDRKIVLGNIYSALKPGGFLILDVWTMKQYNEFSNCQSVTYENGGFWSENPYVCIKRNYRYDETNTFLEQYLIITEEESSCYNIWNAAFDQKKIWSEMEEVGFDQSELYSDVSGRRFYSDSNTLCVLAKKTKA
jgi:SAM-dependent methyltransferase